MAPRLAVLLLTGVHATDFGHGGIGACVFASSKSPFPGLAVNPQVKLSSFKYYFRDTVGLEPPRNYWYLDALAIMRVISAHSSLSYYAVNIGARPQMERHVGEDGVNEADQATGLYRAGWAGLNFDLSANRGATDGYYRAFGGAQQVAYDVFPPGVAEELRARGVARDLDFLKVDVDSFVCEFLERILEAGYQPKVIVAEVNVCMVPPIRFSMRYSPGGLQHDDFVAAGSFSGFGFDIADCSLKYADDYLRSQGYSLLQFPLQDGWWVRDEFVPLFGNVSHDPVVAFRMGNPCFFGQFPTMMRRWFGNPSPSVLDEAYFMVRRTLNALNTTRSAEYVLEL